MSGTHVAYRLHFLSFSSLPLQDNGVRNKRSAFFFRDKIEQHPFPLRLFFEPLNLVFWTVRPPFLMTDAKTNGLSLDTHSTLTSRQDMSVAL
jgi:hypothetical protein